MELELFYVVRKYTYGAGVELEKPLYKAGPFQSYLEAGDFIAGEWLHNKCYAVVKSVIEVDEY